MVIIIYFIFLSLVIECQEELVDPENGVVTVNSITFQSEAMYNCNTGYDLEGSSTAVCQSNAAWSNWGLPSATVRVDLYIVTCQI